MLPCDVTNDAQLAALGGQLEESFGGLDFALHGVAYAPAAELSQPFVAQR